jgi:mRNA-degrading endonuclease toxin of MazEF toxin-antitoxin module
VATFGHGSIVRAKVLDPQGQNEKNRPLVIVSRTEEIRPGEPLYCVAVTSTFSKPLEESAVALPYHPNGHPRTGLKKKCVASCKWLIEIQEANIEKIIGRVPDSEMSLIRQKVDALDRQRP